VDLLLVALEDDGGDDLRGLGLEEGLLPALLGGVGDARGLVPPDQRAAPVRGLHALLVEDFALLGAARLAEDRVLVLAGHAPDLGRGGVGAGALVDGGLGRRLLCLLPEARGRGAARRGPVALPVDAPLAALGQALPRGDLDGERV